MTTLYKSKEKNSYFVFVKGAAEIVLDQCNYIVTDKGVQKLDSSKKTSLNVKNKFFLFFIINQLLYLIYYF